MKKLFSIFAMTLLLLTPSMSVASSTQTPTESIEDSPIDFGTDSYDEDGCFC